MQVKVPTYIEIISEKYPAVKCHAIGDGSTYGSIVHDGGDAIPSQVDLDSHVLEMSKADAKAKINEFRKVWMNDYFTYDFKRWNCDDEAVTNIIGTLLIGLVNGNTLPEGFVWRDYDNTDHPVDFMYIVYMAITAMTFKKAVYSMSWVHKASIDSLPNIQALLDYDSTIGWPTKDA